MATKPTDRHCTVHFYDVIISSRSAKGYKVSSPACAPISSLFEALLVPNAKNYVLNPNAKVVMKSLDDLHTPIKSDDGYSLLLNCADLSKPDPRFKHFKTRALRAAGKHTAEAVTKSCHALLLPDKTVPNKALLIMTMHSGILADDIAEMAFPQISRQIMMSKLKWRNANATSEICPRI